MFESLDEVERDIAERLKRAASDRRSPMHVPTIGTADADLRMMVLRAFDPASMTCRLHTDARSPKCALIADGAPVGLLFFDPEKKIQIRARGVGRVEVRGPLADAAWADANEYARRCYLTEGGPGSVLEEPGSGLPPEIEGIRPSEDQLLPARANFAVLVVELGELDWLYLAHDGHRRAQFVVGGEARWIEP